MSNRRPNNSNCSSIILQALFILCLSPIEESTTHRRFCAIVLAELRLIVRGQNRWWLLVASGFVVASLFCPLNVVRHYLLPAAWLWPILSWSALGNRELRHHTGQIVFSTSNVFRCQLLATWFAGFLTAILTGCGTGARLVLAGLWDHFLTWAIGAAFIPSLALALGVWSRNSRLFEMIYVLWWYLGSIGGVAVLDYMNIKSRAVTDDISIMYVVASILLFGVAVVGRHRQLRHD